MAQLAAWMDQHGLPEQRKAALDFGCGVGRLTQALCQYFDLCVGVDIAPSMIAKAKEFNKHGKSCIYRLNEDAKLASFPDKTFDLVHTRLVLQHIRPQIAQRYIAEFVRVLRPGGLAAFQCPSTENTFAYPAEGIDCKVETTCTSISMEALGKAVIPVRVTNTGRLPLGISKTLNSPIRVVNHWSCLSTGELQANAGYMNVTKDILEPGESFDFDYEVPAPATAGDYILILDTADFFNRSFTRNADEYVLIQARVTPHEKTDTGPEALATQRPRTEMHHIPIETVTGIVKAMGGRILDVDSVQVRPGALVSTTYYVTR